MPENIQLLKKELSGLQQKYHQIEKTNQKLNEKLVELYSLYKISLTLSATFEIQAVLKAIREVFRKTFHLDEFSLMLFDEKNESLYIRTTFGLPSITGKQKIRLDNMNVFREAITKEKPIHIQDMTQFAPDFFLLHSNKKKNTGAFLSIPLLAENEQTIGLINLKKDTTDGFSNYEMSLLNRIAQQVGKVIDKSLLFHQTKELSITDELTGIYNRRYFNQRYEREILRARRYDRSLAVLMIDIDHFKKYNDTHGHIMGDEVLQKFTKVLDANIRKADVLARYGGEEFVLILPEINKEKALQAAEKFRHAIESHSFPGGETQPLGKLTISTGLATFPTDAEDANTLLDTADKALYVVKSNARNAVGYCLDPANQTYAIQSVPGQTSRQITGAVTKHPETKMAIVAN